MLLLASDTPEGLACAEVVEAYLVRYWDGLQVVTETVPGLQVDDAEQFRRVGVVEFTRRCLREIANYQIVGGRELSNIVLNPTGGFKALVPYTVLIGMLKNVPCRYIFEQSTTLLELPPLPVEFSRSRFEAFKPLFERIERDSSVSLDDYEPFQFLTRMSSPQMLDKHEHINAGNGLRWLKPGRTTDRYLVSVEGWRLLVWRAIREDQVVVEGRAPIWRYGMAFHLLHGSAAAAVAVYDPRIGAVVVASLNPGFREGQIPDVDLPSKPDSTLKL